MDNMDIRWKQRFNQFLKSTIAIEQPTVIERAGLIKFFEMSFKLGWKLLKHYQEAEVFVINSPRDAIKQAFQSQTIQARHSSINALEDRNLTTHTYNEQTAATIEQKTRQDYYPLLLQLQQTFTDKTGKQ